ncbi:PAS domain S-box protein [Actinoplanes sp. NPDC026670]|uniref:hybrid sensor histidine kinase/response regulator n=1 Tax=Actinoplanes sp. NPDC026670 TaxID=3154700 RepID=UPI0033F15305
MFSDDETYGDDDRGGTTGDLPAVVSGELTVVSGARDAVVSADGDRPFPPDDSLFRQLVDAAPDAMVGADCRGRIVFVNGQAQRLFGYGSDELIGRPIEILVPTEITDAHRELRQRYVAAPVHRAMGSGQPLRARRKDGTVFPAEISLSGLHTGAGLIVSAAVRDITDRLRAEDERVRLREAADRSALQAQLQRTQRMESLGQLAGGVAHDFNNLLAVIVNYAAFISDSAQEQPDDAAADVWAEVLRDAQQIMRAARRGGDLTRQLLAFARQEVVRPQAVAWATVVHGVEDMLRRSIGEHIALTITCRGDCGPVMADPGQLDQILVNLAVNARDAMPDGGSLTIETDSVFIDADYVTRGPAVSPGEYARLRVSDSGTGMPREVVEKIFEPFFTTKPAGRGTGLGLAMVYGIVTGAAGTVSVQSQEGFGTTITILLPVTDQRPTTDHTGDLRRDEVAGHGETVLLVEDEPSLRQVCHRLLDASGYHVLAPDDTIAAVELARQHPGPIDLLLTDVVMPTMLGTALAAQVTANRDGMKVLFMSGYATPILADLGPLDPAITLLEKPFTRRELLTAVHHALAG